MAAPHSPDNRKLARECRDVKVDRVYIGSCTGGKTEDFLAAAKLLHGAGQEVKIPTYLVPATQKVRQRWEGGWLGWVWLGWVQEGMGGCSRGQVDGAVERRAAVG